MENKSVGIVIPVYNNVQYLDECLLSCTNQTYKDVEVLVVDDASTEDVKCVCDKYGVDYLRLGTNSGSCSKPLNIGLTYMAKKHWAVYHVDSDDYLRGDAVELMVQTLDEVNGAMWVNSAYQQVGDANGLVDIKEDLTKVDMKNQNGLSSFAMFTSDFWLNRGWLREDMACEDWELWVRSLGRFESEQKIFMESSRAEKMLDIAIMLTKYVHPYAVVHEPIYYYRVHAGQETKKVDIDAAHKKILELHFDDNK